jgi:hypothetical protein
VSAADIWSRSLRVSWTRSRVSWTRSRVSWTRSRGREGGERPQRSSPGSARGALARLGPGRGGGPEGEALTERSSAAKCSGPPSGLSSRVELRLRGRSGRREAVAPGGVVAKWLGNGLQNRHTWVRIPSTPRRFPRERPPQTLGSGAGGRDTRHRVRAGALRAGAGTASTGPGLSRDRNAGEPRFLALQVWCAKIKARAVLR